MSSKTETELDKLNNVSERLKYLVDNLGVKQSHMAKKIGLSASGLHYILNNDVKYSKNAKKIADYLNISHDWLATGEGSPDEGGLSQEKSYTIPVYYPDQIKLMRLNLNEKIQPKGVHVSRHSTANSIGVYVTDNDFSPKFELGDIVIFNKRKKSSKWRYRTRIFFKRK